MGNTVLLCMPCRGIGPHLVARRNSHDFSRVAAGTWGTFSSIGGDIHSKLMFVQRCQDSCLVTRYSSGIFLRHGRAIQTLLEVRWETQCPYLVASVISGYLSFFNKCQALSPFEASNSMCLLRFQRDVRPPFQMRQGPRAFSRFSTGDSDISSSCEMKDKPAIQAIAGKSGLFSSQGILVSIPLETENSGYLSHTYCSRKTPLEVLVESWLTSSVEASKSALISR